MAILHHLEWDIGAISLLIKGWNGDKNGSCLKYTDTAFTGTWVSPLLSSGVLSISISVSVSQFEEFEEPNFSTWRTLKENWTVQRGEHLTQARPQPGNVSQKQIRWQLQEGLTTSGYQDIRIFFFIIDLWVSARSGSYLGYGVYKSLWLFLQASDKKANIMWQTWLKYKAKQCWLKKPLVPQPCLFCW